MIMKTRSDVERMTVLWWPKMILTGIVIVSKTYFFTLDVHFLTTCVFMLPTEFLFENFSDLKFDLNRKKGSLYDKNELSCLSSLNL